MPPRQRRRHYSVTETGFSLEPELLQESRHRVARHWRKFGKSLARRVFAGAAGLAAAGLANLVTRVPQLDMRPITSGDEPAAKRQCVQDKSGYIQLTRLRNEQLGKELVRQEMLNRHVETLMQSRIDRFQNMSSAAANNGKYWLAYSSNAVAASATKWILPCYLFDLTSLNTNTTTNNGGAAAVYRSQPFVRLVRQTPASPAVNYYDWSPQNGVDNTNVSQPQWGYERLPYQAANNANNPYSKALLRWADIRLQMWGATTEPSAIEVSIVRFTDENIGPPSFFNDDTVPNTLLSVHAPPAVPGSLSAAGVNDFAQYQKFWTSQMDRFVGTPLAVRLQNKDSKGMVVLWHKRIDFNPTAQYETDQTGHQYTLKLRYIMDMIGSYNHYNSQSVVGDQISGNPNFDNPNHWSVTTDQLENHCVLRNKNSRVFLMIRGFCPKANIDASGFGTTQDNASFDLMVRREITVV